MVEAKTVHSGGQGYEVRGQTKDALCNVEEAIAHFDSAVRINPEDAEVYFNKGWPERLFSISHLPKTISSMRKTWRKSRGSRSCCRTLTMNLNDLNVKPFRVFPHSSEYVSRVDPDRLKEKLHDLDDELFIRKSLK